MTIFYCREAQNFLITVKEKLKSRREKFYLNYAKNGRKKNILLSDISGNMIFFHLDPFPYHTTSFLKKIFTTHSFVSAMLDLDHFQE